MRERVKLEKMPERENVKLFDLNPVFWSKLPPQLKFVDSFNLEMEFYCNERAEMRFSTFHYLHTANAYNLYAAHSTVYATHSVVKYSLQLTQLLERHCFLRAAYTEKKTLKTLSVSLLLFCRWRNVRNRILDAIILHFTDTLPFFAYFGPFFS